MLEDILARQLRFLDILREIYPRMTLDMMAIFLFICYRERVPLTEIAERFGIIQANVSRNVSDLSEDGQYKGTRVEKGFGLVYTEEDPENRVRKIAYLTDKGREVKAEIMAILEGKIPVKASNRKKKQ